MSTTFAIVKRPHNELFIYCMAFTYGYNRFSTLIILVNNPMVSFGNLFIIGAFE